MAGFMRLYFVVGRDGEVKNHGPFTEKKWADREVQSYDGGTVQSILVDPAGLASDLQLAIVRREISRAHDEHTGLYHREG